MDRAENERRPHHYQFAHKVLPEIAQDLGRMMLDEESADEFGPRLISLWDDFGRRLPAEERLPSDGLRATLMILGPHRLLVVVLPRPIARAEAYYTAVVRPAGTDRCRYFTLEYAVNPFTQEPYTVLGEWADGSHLSHGSGPASDLSLFLTAVLELVNESGSEPDDAAGHPAPPEPRASPERRGLRRLFGR